MSKVSTWTITYQPPVAFKDVAKIKTHASRWRKFLLLFKPTQYSYDGDHTIPYKDMGKRRYVLMKKIRPLTDMGQDK